MNKHDIICHRLNVRELERKRRLLLDTAEAALIREIALPILDQVIKQERKALEVGK